MESNHSAGPQDEGDRELAAKQPINPLNFTCPRPHTSYSASGFDLLKVLAYLANRPNPTINIGPVDLSCAFLLVDVCKPDLPIVYSSPTFQTLTGYATHEVIGRNCRFLQSPDGWVASGSRRKFTDNAQVLTMKQEIGLFREHQSSIVNYKKGGKPFINLLTMIPIFENGFVNYYVGLQVDLVEQPGAIMKHMQDGKYAVKYGIHTFTKEVKPGVEKLLGYTPTELVGKALADICHPGDILPVLRDLKEASNSGSACLLYRGIIKSGALLG
ncbi:hypothetical protein L0F63_001596 [Massospora cicadina]|nr:hypothetical protein L0F63_001596 [Massospora cicadina]